LYLIIIFLNMVLIKNIFIFWLQDVELIVELYHIFKNQNVKTLLKMYILKILKILCWCWWAFLCLQNGGNSPPKKPLVTSLVFVLNFQKNWIRFMMISKIEIKCFQINLMLKLFMLVGGRGRLSNYLNPDLCFLLQRKQM
jgi:hypothetical protein